MAAVGGRIRIARMRRKMTQPELARRIGVTYQLVQRYEQRGGQLTVDRLMAIANALDTDPKDLMPDYAKPKLMVPPKLGFYGRPALSHLVDFDVQIRAACGAPPDAPGHLLWPRWYAGIHADDRARLDAGLVHLHDPLIGVCNVQYRLLGWDGVERCIIDLGHMIFDAEQQPVRLQGVMFDITDEPRTKNAAERTASVLAAVSRDVLKRDDQIRSLRVS